MVDVLIPTKNSERTLEACLKSVLFQRLHIPVLDVYICDGHSKDHTVVIAKTFPTKILTENSSNPSKGSHRAIACNQLLKASNSPVVAFIDSDCVVPETWLRDLIPRLSRDNRIAGVTSGCQNPKKKDFSFVLSRIMSIGSSHARAFDKIEEVESIPGYNSVYLREAIVSIGGFNESIGGCEDYELNYHLRKAGWKLLAIPSSPVEHRRSYTFKSFSHQMYWYGWSRSRLLKKTHIFTPLHITPSLALAFIIFLTFLFTPREFSFFTSVFKLHSFPVVEKLFESYFFTISLSSFILLSKDFTPKLWLQGICAFLIQHVSYAIGYIKGLFD